MSEPEPLADADLIAYLDGELDEAATEAIEARLAADSLARKRAAAFRRSFALLDALPRVEPKPDFTARTVTRLHPVRASAITRPFTAPRRRGAWVAIAAVVLAGAFGAAARVAVHPTATPAATLMTDLPVIEALPLYLGADDLAFVRRLDTPDLFAGPPATNPFTPADPSPDDRDALAAAFRRFSPARQQQLRTLHADLNGLPPPDRDRLGQVLERYAGWLGRVPDAERSRVLAAPTAAARLTAVEDAVLTSRREALPARKREHLSTLRTDERLQLLADVQAGARATRSDWDRAADHWRTLAAAGVRPWPFDQPEGVAQVQEFVRAVLRSEPPGKGDGELSRLTAAELVDLRARHDVATKDGHWFLYGLQVWRLAERHPSLPRPRGKPPVLTVRDLPDLRVRPQIVNQLEKRTTAGRWPEFARDAAVLLSSKKVVLPVASDVLGPCRPGEFPEAVEAVLTELLPLLSGDERKRLDAAKGKWPEYPDYFMRLAREKDKPVPGVTLPGAPSKWAATYARP